MLSLKKRQTIFFSLSQICYQNRKKTSDKEAFSLQYLFTFCNLYIMSSWLSGCRRTHFYNDNAQGGENL